MLAVTNFASEIYSRRPANRNFLAEIASCKLQTGIFLPKSLSASCKKEFFRQSSFLQAAARNFFAEIASCKLAVRNFAS
ncbi:hypothetical protein JFY68_01435 [Porphyromonas gingivalis]|uniref:hypothetical protein n=1 Tax=Porphyromonas gingivalis TaxID=837 RepID=UPI00136575A1|nr:hypothetical protein [Porphyromonas gingivalis]MCE8172241.1 hypothetical protein [Porphyromonas gingivalis]